MLSLQSSSNYYEQRQAISVTAALATKKLWQRVGADFDPTWNKVAPAILETVSLGRAAIAAVSVPYTAAVLEETAQVDAPEGVLAVSRFLETAPNGQPMADVLAGAVVQAKVAVKSGATTTLALEQAGSWLTGVVLTTMADTGRSIVGADIAQRPNISGYVRMLNAPSCSRCVILAGKHFRWNEGFQRHPRCDCQHIPASEDVGGDLRTDPYEYFASLTPDEQTKTFGRIEARAIRDGGDIYRIENIKARGLATAKARAKYGTPTRLTIDDIYRQAGTRTNAIRMMKEEGFLTGPQIRGGNVIGQREGFGQLGKGGKARAASDAVTKARETGIRDPLNRYTMTAQERGLFDAKYRLDEARRTGNWPRSIGENSADLYSRPTPLGEGDLALLERVYSNQLAKLPKAPASVKKLAKLLGIPQ